MAATDRRLDRLVDACRNRVAEGLRTLEDLARFVLNDTEASTTLKRLRHGLRETIASGWDEQRLLGARDTSGDVGTAIETPSESHRQTQADIAGAAASRVREGLRSLEEAAKTIDADVARQLQMIRYETYDVAARLGTRLQLSVPRQWRVCLLLTIDACSLPWMQVFEASIAGGIDCVQIREKHMADATLVSHACDVVRRAHAKGVSVVINDRPDIALASGADGVHLGQDDMSVAAARQVLGQGPLIGVSTHSVDEAQAAIAAGADSIGIGPVFASATRPELIAAGPMCVTQTLTALGNVPHLAIGGIDSTNIGQVTVAGAQGVAVGSAMCSAASPSDVAALLCSAMQCTSSTVTAP